MNLIASFLYFKIRDNINNIQSNICFTNKYSTMQERIFLYMTIFLWRFHSIRYWTTYFHNISTLRLNRYQFSQLSYLLMSKKWYWALSEIWELIWELSSVHAISYRIFYTLKHQSLKNWNHSFPCSEFQLSLLDFGTLFFFFLINVL